MPNYLKRTNPWTLCPNPSLQVNSVAICDDGSGCVFGTSNEFSSGKFETYYCNNSGKIIWKEAVSEKKTYQGVFWTSISGDGQYVASGGEHSKTNGFLKAYRTSTGETLLDDSFNSRINQVSLSKDGTLLAACYGSELAIYNLEADGSRYVLRTTQSAAPYNLNSCEISRKGNTVVASAIKYNDNENGTTTEGKIFSYSISKNTVTALTPCDLPTGAMRVAIVSSGNFWAASLHDGSCVLVDKRTPQTYQWQYIPKNVSLSLAYAIDITETDNYKIYVACGANVHDTKNKGLLYLVRSEVEKDQHKGVLQWTVDIPLAVNPGVSLDKNANYVTATDGQPNNDSYSESAGAFYLFKGDTGEKVWQYPTTLMNWPMALAYDGKSVFGGSDNGSVYYWKLE